MTVAGVFPAVTGDLERAPNSACRQNDCLRAENLERQWGGKALEHQLRYSNLIINSINDLVFVLTRSLNITRVNPAVGRHTGIETKDLIASPISRLLRCNGQEPIDRLSQALRDGRELQDLPVELLCKQSAIVPYRLSLFPLRDRDKVVGCVVTLRIHLATEQPANAAAG